jgi:hypothetical protein
VLGFVGSAGFCWVLFGSVVLLGFVGSVGFSLILLCCCVLLGLLCCWVLLCC